MTKELKTLGLIFGGVVVYNLISKSWALNDINFLAGSVRNVTFDGVTPVAEIGLLAQNTSGQQFNVNSLTGDLFVVQDMKNIYIGNVSSFERQTIFPNSQVQLRMMCRLSILGIVNELIQVFQYKNYNMRLKLSGVVNVDNYRIPVNTTFNVI